MNSQHNNSCLIKEQFLLVLDSRNASYYKNGSYNSNLSFYFEDPITKPKNSIVMTCSVVSFICPVSFYQINYTNNKLTISANSTNYNIVVPYGNYTTSSFIAALTPLLPSGFSITVSSLTNRFTLKYSADFSIIVATSTIYAVMGFSKAINLTSSLSTLVLPYCCNFSGINSLNIFLTNLNTKNIDSFNKSNSSIITSIPVNSPPSGVLIYEKKFDFEFCINQNIIDHIDIELLDDLENSIDLNNQHFNLTLQFTILREKEIRELSFFDVLKNPYPFISDDND
jgi:hypothetical protein